MLHGNKNGRLSGGRFFCDCRLIVYTVYFFTRVCERSL
ncbi:Uncharacterised protein [Chromobacterium vaccinii]|nr:Uncharacterised protein [Chromobacterium vaccinii]